jgi:hypothetical protein
MYFQTAKHDYGHACNDWHDCFWVNWFYPVRVKSLQPDIVLPLKFEDWNAGRDDAYFTARDLAERLQVADSHKGCYSSRSTSPFSILKWLLLSDRNGSGGSKAARPHRVPPVRPGAALTPLRAWADDQAALRRA